MSHTYPFHAFGWAKAILIGDGYALEGSVELRAWYPPRERPLPSERDVSSVDHPDPDFRAKLEDDGIFLLFTRTCPENPSLSLGRERDLLFAAGRALATRRIKAKLSELEGSL